MWVVDVYQQINIIKKSIPFTVICKTDIYFIISMQLSTEHLTERSAKIEPLSLFHLIDTTSLKKYFLRVIAGGWLQTP